MNHLVHALCLSTIFSQIILQCSLIARKGQAGPAFICHTFPWMQLNAFFSPKCTTFYFTFLCQFNFSRDIGFQKKEETQTKKKSHWNKWCSGYDTEFNTAQMMLQRRADHSIKPLEGCCSVFSAKPQRFTIIHIYPLLCFILKGLNKYLLL